MRLEDRLLLRVVVRAVVPLVVVGLFAVSGTYYRYGPSLEFFAVVLGVPLVLFMVARAVLLRRRAPTGAVGTPTRAAESIKRRAGDTLASTRRARRRARVRQVEAAAREAAGHQEELSPEAVRGAAESLFRLVRHAWSHRDHSRLAMLLGSELLADCEQRLARGERSGLDEGLDVIGEVHVEYVGFDRSESGPRAVVLIEAVLGRRASNRRRLCQYWTLALRDGLWTVARIEGPSEGRRHLTEPIPA